MTQTQTRRIGSGKGGSFLSESVAELKKVTFPTRQQTIQATLITVLLVMVISLALFLLDVIFGQLMRAILG